MDHELDLFLRILYFTLGIIVVLSFGWVAWNSKLIYYRIVCRLRGYHNRKKYEI